MGAKDLSGEMSVGLCELSFSATSSSLKNSYGKAENKVFDWNIENTIAYDHEFGVHHVGIFTGQGAHSMVMVVVFQPL